MTGYYILNGRETVAEPDLMAWADWYERADRTVAKTNTNAHRVSTVFLGLNHSFGDGPPVLFETMVFRLSDDETGQDWKEVPFTDRDGDCWRYSTWDEAEAGHQEAVAETVAMELDAFTSFTNQEIVVSRAPDYISDKPRAFDL